MVEGEILLLLLLIVILFLLLISMKTSKKMNYEYRISKTIRKMNEDEECRNEEKRGKI